MTYAYSSESFHKKSSLLEYISIIWFSESLCTNTYRLFYRLWCCLWHKRVSKHRALLKSSATRSHIINKHTTTMHVVIKIFPTYLPIIYEYFTIVNFGWFSSVGVPLFVSFVVGLKASVTLFYCQTQTSYRMGNCKFYKNIIELL